MVDFFLFKSNRGVLTGGIGMIFITFDVTVQWTLTCCGRRRKHKNEIPISKLIFYPPVSHNKQKIFQQDKRSR